MKGKIVKIDYQTVTQMQPIFQHKNIFADSQEFAGETVDHSERADKSEQGRELTKDWKRGEILAKRRTL
jgi:hypothetical protein